MRTTHVVFLLCSALTSACSQPSTPPPAHAAPAQSQLEEKTAAALAAELASGSISSERLVEVYLGRIAELDPQLHAVLAINPHARELARALDRERAEGHIRGPLHGMPLLVKDNIETADALPTTAGSLALADNVNGRDAALVAQLRAAGAVVLGKTNLSEWANIRSSHATSGWSALGGLTKNPYALTRNACGSSSGSAVAVAANLIPWAIGTETDGSITCPSSMVGVVGLKPTLGVVSGRGIIPISSAQDTAGPLARSVRDAAMLLSAMAEPPRDYTAALSTTALSGSRLGVLKSKTGYLPQVDALFDAAVLELQRAGAQLEVIVQLPVPDDLDDSELSMLLADFRVELNAYLASTSSRVQTRSLSELIAFNRAHAERELPYFGQELFERAEATSSLAEAERLQLREQNRKRAREILDRVFVERHLDALIAPTQSPAFTNDLIIGDHVLGGTAQLPAMAGYPHLTVPMGQLAGLPVGLSFIGQADADAKLLGLAYAFEQRTQARHKPEFRDGNEAGSETQPRPK